MNPAVAEEKKKEAFRLFEKGDYPASFQICQGLVRGSSDPAVSVLCAANLFHMGRLEEAEAHFRDLAVSFPGSSHVHSYLGRILQEKGDDRALPEYARAVVLDPENLEALRSYASHVMSLDDPKKAIPVLRHLAELSRRPDDTRMLSKAYQRAGLPEEALRVWNDSMRGVDFVQDHIDILLACRRFDEVRVVALGEFRRSGDVEAARKYLYSLARTSPGDADTEYGRILKETDDSRVRLDYVTFLRSRGMPDQALRELFPLLAGTRGSEYGKLILLESDLLAECGKPGEALSRFDGLLDKMLESMEDMDLLGEALARYRSFLMTHYTAREAESKFFRKIDKQTNAVCLLAGAAFYEDIGDMTQARSWYYRAYRSDYLKGGPEYARFLFRQGDFRECEKVMLYVVNSIKKSQDLVRIAGVVMDERRNLYRMPRLLERLMQRLEERAPGLPSGGLELLALVYLLEASRALDSGDFSSCKRLALNGLDIIPFGSKVIAPDDFLQLLKVCKERSLCDLMVLEPPAADIRPGAEAQDAQGPELDLDMNERMIVEFLKEHRQASEMDLRSLVGSRRVVGIVNRIMQKASAQGQKIIEKKGVGENGEIYEYIRS